MYIAPIYSINQNIKSKNSNQKNIKPTMVSFCHSEKEYTLEEILGAKAIISNVVTPYTDKRKPEIVKNMAENVLTDFEIEIRKKLKDYAKTNNVDTKTKLLEKVAENYMKMGDFGKAGVITAFTMKETFNNPKLSAEEKRRRITNEDNMYNLRRTFNTSTDPKARLYVAKTMNEIGYKEFLPLSETICENCIIEDKNILNEARLLINKHYDLSKLASFFDKREDLKIGAIVTLGKWGLPDQVKLILPFLNDKNEKVIVSTIRALGNTKDSQFLNMLVPKLEDPGTWDVRDEALKAVLMMENRHQVMNYLMSRFNKNKPQGDITKSLSKIGDSSILNILNESLSIVSAKKNDFLGWKDTYVGYLADAIVGICKREGKLNNLLSHPNAKIRTEAQSELEKISNQSQEKQDVDQLLIKVNSAYYYPGLHFDWIKLSKIANHEIVDYLCSTIKDGDDVYLNLEDRFYTINKIAKNNQFDSLIVKSKPNTKVFDSFRHRDDFLSYDLFSAKHFDFIKNMLKQNVDFTGSQVYIRLLGSIGNSLEHANSFLPGGDLCIKNIFKEGSIPYCYRASMSDESYEAFAKIFLRGNLVWADKK